MSYKLLFISLAFVFSLNIPAMELRKKPGKVPPLPALGTLKRSGSLPIRPRSENSSPRSPRVESVCREGLDFEGNSIDRKEREGEAKYSPNTQAYKDTKRIVVLTQKLEKLDPEGNAQEIKEINHQIANLAYQVAQALKQSPERAIRRRSTSSKIPSLQMSPGSSPRRVMATSSAQIKGGSSSEEEASSEELEEMEDALQACDIKD